MSDTVKTTTGFLGGNPHLLLDVFQLAVEGDQAPPDFLGTIAVGVQGYSSVRWWTARFEPDGAHSRLTDEQPQDVDATLLISRETALGLLRGSDDWKAIGDAMALNGRRELVERFVQRYLVKKSVVDIRSASPR